MDIIEVSPNLEDYTMKLPVAILTEMNADFDGDILNIIVLKSKDMKRAFRRTFSPRYNMFVSRTTGKFNSNYSLLKDQFIGLVDFCNI